MLWALHIYEIIDALCNVCTKCPWNGSTTDIESVFPSVWHSTSNLSIFINASSMMNNTRHLRIKTSYKITNVVQRCCSFCKVRQKNYQFSSKIRYFPVNSMVVWQNEINVKQITTKVVLLLIIGEAIMIWIVLYRKSIDQKM